MGYVADRWHKTRPKPGDAECGEHKGLVASMAHGKGKRWQARYDDPNGNEVTSLWRTKTEAEAEIVKQEAAKQTGSWLDPKAGKVTVERFITDTWLPAQNILDRTETVYRGVLDLYLIPEWGQREIRSIKPSEAGAWQQKLTTKYNLKGTYPNRVSGYVRSVFRLAVTDRVIPVSPFDGIKAPSPGERMVQPPDVVEVQQLIAAAYKPLWAAMIELTALTGMRSGEVRGLALENVDFLRRTISVEQQLIHENKKPLYLDKLKTSSGKRVIPITQRAVDLLAAYVQKYPPRTEGPWAGVVFMLGTEPVKRATINWALKATCKKAGVGHRHWHELRHHYASVLIAGGENPKVVQRRLGHKDVMTTMRTYAHLFAEADEQTRGVLEAAWAPKGESAVTAGRIPESRGAQVLPLQVSG